MRSALFLKPLGMTGIPCVGNELSAIFTIVLGCFDGAILLKSASSSTRQLIYATQLSLWQINLKKVLPSVVGRLALGAAGGK